MRTTQKPDCNLQDSEFTQVRRDYNGISINTSQNTHETVFGMVSSTAAMRVVDIPCGSGAFIQRLKDNGYRNVLGVDICDDLSIEHDGFVVGDMTAQLPLEDSSVDTLVCIDGIEHIDRQQDFIAEAFRVLRSGGELIISTPNISALRSRWKWFLTGHHNKCNSPLDESHPSPMHHIGLVSLPELRYLLHSVGFRITTVCTNRIKPVSWAYLPMVPLVYLATSLVYRSRGKKDNTGQLCCEVKRQMFSKAVLFGETMIVRAVR
jgi:ubiquinone/menaquinone biosynthesis C-methylase UbiE